MRSSAEILRNFVANHQHYFDKSHERTIYFIGLSSCLLSHVSYLIMFIMMNVREMVYVNIGSILFYIGTLIFVPILKNGRSILLYLSDFEIIIHAAIATYLLGWRPDFGMFLLLIIPATFLTQSRRFYIPFIVTFVSLGLYIYLKVTIADNSDVKYVLEDTVIIKTMYLTNTFIGVFILLFSSANYMLQREFMEFQLVEQRETFKKLASIDPLTQLYNRRAMNENIRAIRRDSKSPQSRYVIGIGDIDNFKKVNDTYGHDVGDKVLVYVSALFTSTIPENGCAARWGGEEFLFILPESSVEEGLAFTEKIHSSLRSHVFEIDDCQFSVTMTFGISVGIPADKIDSVIIKADKRLYKGKNNGKNHTEYTD